MGTIQPTRAEIEAQLVNYASGGREAVYWGPFHNDAAKKGSSGKPNFSVNLDTGEWNCFRCGQGGKTLFSLAYVLGSDWEPPENWRDAKFTPKERPPSKVDCLDEAMAAGRGAFLKSPAYQYIQSRGLKPYTALVYGLGYGQPSPKVSANTWEMAKESQLILKNTSTWQWAGSVFYADPLTNPTVVNCRYIPDKDLPDGERWFDIHQNHHTWGDRKVPLGAWRITAQTRTIVVVEGLFDMLIGAQTIAERGLYPEVVCVYTNGSMIAGPLLKWFREHKGYDYVLLPDQDEAGLGGWDEENKKEKKGWKQHLTAALDEGGGKYVVVNTPERLDPDEAFLGGWWPSVI